MSKKAYIGIDGVANATKKAYLGIDGIARRKNSLVGGDFAKISESIISSKK